MLPKEKIQSNFIECGFRKLKNATEQFRVHEASEFYMKAAEKLAGITQKDTDTILRDATMRDQELHGESLKLIFSAIFYLRKQGFPLRAGHESKDGPFNLVLEKARGKKIYSVGSKHEIREHFLSRNIQNEIVELVAHELLREIDDTTNLSGRLTEQFAIFAFSNWTRTSLPKLISLVSTTPLTL